MKLPRSKRFCGVRKKRYRQSGEESSLRFGSSFDCEIEREPFEHWWTLNGRRLDVYRYRKRKTVFTATRCLSMLLLWDVCFANRLKRMKLYFRSMTSSSTTSILATRDKEEQVFVLIAKNCNSLCTSVQVICWIWWRTFWARCVEIHSYVTSRNSHNLKERDIYYNYLSFLSISVHVCVQSRHSVLIDIST